MIIRPFKNFLKSDDKIGLLSKKFKNQFRKRAVRDCSLEYFPSATPLPGRPVAWIISFTPVSSEPRVLRQAAALIESGWRVVVFGAAGRAPPPANWYFCKLPHQIPYSRWRTRMDRVFKAAGSALAKWGIWQPVKVAGGRLYIWSMSSLRWRRAVIEKFLLEQPHLRPRLVISHDYFTCAAGYSVAKDADAAFVVDCHEYARGQYIHDPKWVTFVRPAVSSVQDYYLAKAEAVTTVCEGIANLLNEEQRLRRPVTVVRSVPFRNIQPFRQTTDPINVIYLGDIHYIRGLHKAIKSMPLWRPEFHLILQGGGNLQYIESLKGLAAERGLSDRVHFRPPVPFDDIVPSANMADIGYFVHKDLSPQKRFALPNKFFEYVMAGLALCVSDLPEMARLVRQYDLGRLVADYDESAIAAVINGFDRESIDYYKKRSREAALELNWDTEKTRMLSLYESVVNDRNC